MHQAVSTPKPNIHELLSAISNPHLSLRFNSLSQTCKTTYSTITINISPLIHVTITFNHISIKPINPSQLMHNSSSQLMPKLVTLKFSNTCIINTATESAKTSATPQNRNINIHITYETKLPLPLYSKVQSLLGTFSARFCDSIFLAIQEQKVRNPV